MEMLERGLDSLEKECGNNGERRRQTGKSILFLSGQFVLFCLVLTSLIYVILGKANTENGDISLGLCMENWLDHNGSIEMRKHFSILLKEGPSIATLANVSMSQTSCSIAQHLASKIFLAGEKREGGELEESASASGSFNVTEKE